MNLKERVQDIFNAYSVNLEVTEDVEVKEETALAEKTLANGTVIYTDAEDFLVGATVFIVNEEGERMPLPDGEYEYEVGGRTVITDGAIAEVLEEEEEKEKEMEEEEEVEVKVEMTYTQSEVESMIAKALEDSKEELNKTVSQKDLELKAMKQKLSSVRAEQGLRKSAQPTPKRTSLKDIKQLSKKDRIAAIHDLYLNNN